MGNVLASLGVFCICSLIGMISRNTIARPKVIDLIDRFATGVVIIVLMFHLLGAIEFFESDVVNRHHFDGFRISMAEDKKQNGPTQELLF